MIKIYTDAAYLTPQYRKIIFPLLLDLCYINNLNLLKKYQLVNTIEESDIVIVPVQLVYFFENNKRKWLYNFIDEAIKLNKKVWIYTAGDYGLTLNKPVYAFRLGGFDSKLNSKTFIVPALIIDPYKDWKTDFMPIKKEILPVVGFVGNADASLIKWGKEVLVYLNHNIKRFTKLVWTDYQSFYPSGVKRHQFLSAMQESRQIKTNFIYRKQYRAGAKTEEDKKRTTIEFFENIYNNPYVFCLRGAGNFSIRLYETLAMGRIPVIIDTDIRLPLHAIINWKNHCVIASEHDFIDKLIHFHQNISENDFEQLQINNRNLWLNYLNRESFFSRIYDIFNEDIQ
jgi:hypothetical protein